MTWEHIAKAFSNGILFPNWVKESEGWVNGILTKI